MVAGLEGGAQVDLSTLQIIKHSDIVITRWSLTASNNKESQNSAILFHIYQDISITMSCSLRCKTVISPCDAWREWIISPGFFKLFFFVIQTVSLSLSITATSKTWWHNHQELILQKLSVIIWSCCVNEGCKLVEILLNFSYCCLMKQHY